MARKINNTSLNKRVIITVVILLGFAAFLYVSWGGLDTFEKTESRVDFVSAGFELRYDYDANVNCFSDGAGFYFCSSDGVKRFDNKGDKLWDYPLNYTTPVMVGEGAYIAVSERRGKSLDVFGQEGLLYTKHYDDDVVSYSLNIKGYASVIIADAQGYTNYVYNSAGEELTVSIISDKNNYPVSTDISDDGRIRAVSFLDTSLIAMSSNVSFYYINKDEYSNFTDGLFATSAKVEGQIISKVSFIGDNYLFYVADSQIGCYETESNDKLINLLWSKDINNEITHAGLVSEKIIAVALGSGQVNKDSEKEGALLLYGVDGNEIARHEEGGPVSFMFCGRGTVIIGRGNLGRNFTAISDKGKVLWDYSATMDAADMVILDNLDKVAFSSTQSLTILERKKVIEVVEKTEKPKETDTEEDTNPAILPDEIETPISEAPVPEAPETQQP